MKKSSDNHPIFHDNHLDRNIREPLMHIEYLTRQEMKEDIQLALLGILAEDLKIHEQPERGFCDYVAMCEWRNQKL